MIAVIIYLFVRLKLTALRNVNQISSFVAVLSARKYLVSRFCVSVKKMKESNSGYKNPRLEFITWD